MPVSRPNTSNLRPPRSDPSHNVLRAQLRGLDAIFKPSSVAVVGATDKPASVGRSVLENLVSAFKGKIFAINPKRSEVLGIKCYPNITAVPERVDLAVIVTPAATVPNLIAECIQAEVAGAVVISAGFKELGPEGAVLERQIQTSLRGSRMRLIGPNCLGVMNPLIGLNATFAPDIARPGKVAFISQSGALLTAILDWSLRELVGFSAFVSTGSMLDVGWGDLIDYFGADPYTGSILLYMESVGDARTFLSAAREVALTKPIIVIKAGKSEAASKAAASHTGSLTGSDEVLDAAFRRCGVLRVGSISDLFHMAEVLGKQQRPRGPRLTLVTNAGGPAVLATDALISTGGQLATLSPATHAALNRILPTHWSRGNPIDILGDADPGRYAEALKVAAHDPESDALLVIMAPQGMTDPAQVAERLVEYARIPGKPILASLMGGARVAQAEQVLNAADIPTFAFPDTAARIFSHMWLYTENLRALYETPTLAEEFDTSTIDRNAAQKIIADASARGRTILTEVESKQLLAHYGLPTVPTKVATTEEEAVRAAVEFGYPVVLKLHSETITHKTDVGGVELGLAEEAAVRGAYRRIETSVTEKAGRQHFLGVAVQPMVRLSGYELILGSTVDAQFGPVLLFGSGGQLVEVYKDRALGLPPLNTTLARRLMERTLVFTALKGVRGRRSVDLAKLEELLVRFSQLVIELPRIREIDINPLLASPDGLLALDARVILHERTIADSDLPKPAIRPYPAQYVANWKSKDGLETTIRPIRPEDEPLMVKFHATLSERSVYLRYFHALGLGTRVAHERLIRICFVDFDREIALIALVRDPQTGEHRIVAVGRLSRMPDRKHAEIAVLVSDLYQRRGIGSELLRRLIAIAKDEKVESITANILPENREMQALAAKAGFEFRRESDFIAATLCLSGVSSLVSPGASADCH